MSWLYGAQVDGPSSCCRARGQAKMIWRIDMKDTEECCDGETEGWKDFVESTYRMRRFHLALIPAMFVAKLITTIAKGRASSHEALKLLGAGFFGESAFDPRSQPPTQPRQLRYAIN